MTMPWEIDVRATEELRSQLTNPADAHLWFVTRNDSMDIPPMLRRDANNRAPFMGPRVKIIDVNSGPSLYDTIAAALSPSTNLPTFDPATLPPWVSKS
jgi:hypothetical protein